jgi:hypothetical protein
MITAAKADSGDDLAQTLQDLKDGKNVEARIKDKVLQDARWLLNKDIFQALLDRGANPN